jgi:hypothetical protein
VLETQGLDVDEALLASWREGVARATRFLEWDAGLPIVARRHIGGVSLAFGAPLDRLFTATEVNEWAWCAALVARGLARTPDLEVALLTAARDIADEPDEVVPPVLDERAAFARFQQLAHEEQRPRLLDAIGAASHRGVRHVIDERNLTLGTGADTARGRCRSFPPPRTSRGRPFATCRSRPSRALTARPRRCDSWLRAHAPTAGATGSAARTECSKARVSSNRATTAGPAGTRRVLRDASIDAAVLEMARGGILRRGLAVETADVAVVTNVSSDHFGEFGIDDLRGLADAKFVVAHLVAEQGLLVLNADDAQVRETAAALPARLGRSPTVGWFAFDYDAPPLREHRVAGGATCGVRNGHLLLSSAADERDLGAIDAMPLTAGGSATYNVSNLAGAALAATRTGHIRHAPCARSSQRSAATHSTMPAD